MAKQFDPVPACFCGVEFLPLPRLERIVLDRLSKFERHQKIAPAFPIDIETMVEVVEEIQVHYFDGNTEFEHEVLGAYDFTQKKMFVRESIDHEGRRRFTWAHEYGHVVLHSGHFLQQVFDFFENSNDGSVQLHRGTSDTRNKLEWQANQFASHILMPTHLVTETLGSRKSSLSEDELVSELATLAVVSKHASRIRLSQLGWINQNSL